LSDYADAEPHAHNAATVLHSKQRTSEEVWPAGQSTTQNAKTKLAASKAIITSNKQPIINTSTTHTNERKTHVLVCSKVKANPSKGTSMTQLILYNGAIRFRRRELKSVLGKEAVHSKFALPRDVLVEVVAYLFASPRDVFGFYSSCRTFHTAVVLSQSSVPFKEIDKWTHALCMAALWSEGTNYKFRGIDMNMTEPEVNCDEFIISDTYRQLKKERSEEYQSLALECAKTLPKLDLPPRTSVIPTNQRGIALRLKNDELYLNGEGKYYGVEVWLVYLIRRVFHARGYVGEGTLTWLGK
jgi:hypothetical protein